MFSKKYSLPEQHGLPIFSNFYSHQSQSFLSDKHVFDLPESAFVDSKPDFMVDTHKKFLSPSHKISQSNFFCSENYSNKAQTLAMFRTPKENSFKASIIQNQQKIRKIQKSNDISHKWNRLPPFQQSNPLQKTQSNINFILKNSAEMGKINSSMLSSALFDDQKEVTLKRIEKIDLNSTSKKNDILVEGLKQPEHSKIPNRVEAQAILNCLKLKYSEIGKRYFEPDSKEYFSLRENLMLAGIQELKLQLGTLCSEWQEVIDIIQDLLNDIFQSLEKNLNSKLKVETDKLQEENLIFHKYLNQTIKEKNEIIGQLNKNFSNQINECKSLKTQIETLSKKEIELNALANHYQKIGFAYKRNYEKLLRETNDLKYKLNIKESDFGGMHGNVRISIAGKQVEEEELQMPEQEEKENVTTLNAVNYNLETNYEKLEKKVSFKLTQVNFQEFANESVAQTDLCLIDSMYDKVFASAENLKNYIETENLKEKINKVNDVLNESNDKESSNIAQLVQELFSDNNATKSRPTSVKNGRKGSVRKISEDGNNLFARRSSKRVDNFRNTIEMSFDNTGEIENRSRSHSTGFKKSGFHKFSGKSYVSYANDSAKIQNFDLEKKDNSPKNNEQQFILVKPHNNEQVESDNIIQQEDLHDNSNVNNEAHELINDKESNNNNLVLQINDEQNSKENSLLAGAENVDNIITEDSKKTKKNNISHFTSLHDISSYQLKGFENTPTITSDTHIMEIKDALKSPQVLSAEKQKNGQLVFDYENINQEDLFLNDSYHKLIPDDQNNEINIIELHPNSIDSVSKEDTINTSLSKEEGYSLKFKKIRTQSVDIPDFHANAPIEERSKSISVASKLLRGTHSVENFSPNKKDPKSNFSYIPEKLIQETGSDEESSHSSENLDYYDENEYPGEEDHTQNDENNEFKEKLLKIVELYSVEAVKTKELKDSVNISNQMLENEKKKFESLKNLLEDMQNENMALKKIQDDFNVILSLCTCNCNERYKSKIEEEKKKEIKKVVIKRKPLRQRTRIKQIISESPFSERLPYIKKYEDHFTQIIEEVKSINLGSFQNPLQLKNIYKIINQIYNSRVDQSKQNKGIRNQSLAEFAYELYYNTFGFENMAQKKLIALLLSIRKKIKEFRIHMFAKFMGLVDGGNFTTQELNLYLDGIGFLENCNMGLPIPHSDTDPCILFPYVRVLEYIKVHIDNKLPPEEMMDFKKEIEALKKPDVKSMNKNGMIDGDFFMEKVIRKWRIIITRTKDYVINAFSSCDIDGNGNLSLHEYVMLERCIEPETFQLEAAVVKFLEWADIDNENNSEKNMSLDKFALMCCEFGTFTHESQLKFVNLKDVNEIEARYEKIKSEWQDNMFQEYLVKMEGESEEWQEKINNLKKKLFSENKPNHFLSLLIAFEMIKKELMRLSAETDEFEKNEAS